MQNWWNSLDIGEKRVVVAVAIIYVLLLMTSALVGIALGDWNMFGGIAFFLVVGVIWLIAWAISRTFIKDKR